MHFWPIISSKILDYLKFNVWLWKLGISYAWNPKKCLLHECLFFQDSIKTPIWGKPCIVPYFGKHPSFSSFCEGTFSDCCHSAQFLNVLFGTFGFNLHAFQSFYKWNYLLKSMFSLYSASICMCSISTVIIL